MFPLGALIAGDPAGAYRQGQQQIQQIDLNQLNLQNAQEDQLAGNLLGSAFQGLVPGASPMPGGPAQPPQAQNPLQMMLQRFRALGAPQQPPMQMGAPQQPPMQMGPPPQASMGPPAPSGGMPPPPGPASFDQRFGQWQGVPPPQAAMMRSGVNGSIPAPMGGPPGRAVPGAAGAAAPSPMPGAGAPPAGMRQDAAGQQGHPGLTWQQVMNAIVQRAPPGMPPRIIAKAVNGAIPLMNSQSRAEWDAIRYELMGLRAMQGTPEYRAAVAGATTAARTDPLLDRERQKTPIMAERAGETSAARTTGRLEAQTAPVEGGGGATLQGRADTIKKMTSGREGQLTQTFNTLTGHLDELRDVAERLENGDVRALNAFQNYFSEQVGNEVVTNFNTVRDIVGDEIVRAVLGGAGNVFDRAELQQRLSSSASRKQLMGSIDRYINLVKQRLGSIKQWYEAGSGLKDYDRWLAPATRKLFEQQPQSGGQQPAGGDGWTIREIK